MKQATYRFITALIIGIFALTPLNIDAKGFSSSRSSSSRSSSSSKPSVSKPAPRVSAPTPAPAPTKNGFSSKSANKSVAAAPPTNKTAFDKSQAIRSITPPKPKEQYIAEFKAKNANKYPNSFATKPAQRPNYIPPTYNDNGVSRPIEYNPATQSYGFMNMLGQFMIFDAITDIAKGSYQKDEAEYKQKVKEIEKMPVQEVKKDEGASWFTIIGCIAVGGVAVVGLIIFLVKIS